MALPRCVQDVLHALLGPAGKSDAALRLAIFDLTRTPAGKAGELPCPTVLAALMEKIADRPWTVSDEDFTKLRAEGYSEDQIFELTTAAAAGAGMRRLDAGWRALEAAGSQAENSYQGAASIPSMASHRGDAGGQ